MLCMSSFIYVFVVFYVDRSTTLPLPIFDPPSLCF